MYLTREEEAVLRGEEGEAAARALQVIVKVGEALGAERLVPIAHAHVSGVSYGNIGEYGVEFIEELARLGGRFRVPTTVNPIGFDLDDPGLTGASRGYVEGQLRVLRALRSMGARLTLSCTPYYDPLVRGLPRGAHVAWGESNAVLYANSVLGLRTNREGGPLALLAAVAGRTYYYGLHLDEYRVPEVEYVVEPPRGGRRLDEAAAGVVGELVARMHRGERPPLIRLPQRPGEVVLRELLAALGAAGSIGMAVIPGVTPEAQASAGLRGGAAERVAVDWASVEARLAELAPPEPVDLVFLGCPHYSAGDLERLAGLLEEAGGARVPVLVSTSREAVEEAARRGVTARLARLGVRLARDTCLIVSPYPVRGLRVATNSYKALFYLRRRGAVVGLAGEEELARLAAGGA